MGKPFLSPRIKEALVWIFWTLVFQFVLINISAAIYAYRITRVYEDGGQWMADGKGNIFSKTWYYFTGPRFGKPPVSLQPVYPYDTVQLKTSSGLLIDCWYAKTDSASRGTVILFPGARTSKSTLIPEAAEFRVQGYNVILVDFRAAGNSGGTVITMGMNEAEDVKLVYDYIQQKGEQKIICWGRSLGAVAIAHAVSKFDLHPAALILEKPYRSLRSFLKSRARDYRFPAYTQGSFSFLLTAWISIERGVNGFKLNTDVYARDIHCPVLVQWGQLDPEVSQEEVQGVYDALPGKKKLIIYPKAGNESLLENDPVQWRKEVQQLITDR